MKMINKDNGFINTSVEYFEELEGTGNFKTKGWYNREKISEILHELQDVLRTNEKDIPRIELFEKLEEIEGLICDFSQNTKREYFKLGLEMKSLIKSTEGV